MRKRYAIGAECAPEVADFFERLVPFKIVDVAVGENPKETLEAWMLLKKKDRSLSWIAAGDQALVTAHLTRTVTPLKN